MNTTKDHIIAALADELVELKDTLREVITDWRETASNDPIADYDEDRFDAGWDMGYARGRQAAANDLEVLL